VIRIIASSIGKNHCRLGNSRDSKDDSIWVRDAKSNAQAMHRVAHGLGTSLARRPSSPGRNFEFPNLGYGLGVFFITRGSRNFESGESWMQKGRERTQEDSRRLSERSLDGESLRGENLANDWKNKGQKRKQADVLRRRPAGITRGSN
jgi:hypothetical protein